MTEPAAVVDLKGDTEEADPNPVVSMWVTVQPVYADGTVATPFKMLCSAYEFKCTSTREGVRHVLHDLHGQPRDVVDRAIARLPHTLTISGKSVIRPDEETP